MTQHAQKIADIVRRHVEAIGATSTRTQRDRVYQTFRERITEGVAHGRFNASAVEVFERVVADIERGYGEDVVAELERLTAVPAETNSPEPGAVELSPPSPAGGTASGADTALGPEETQQARLRKPPVAAARGGTGIAVAAALGFALLVGVAYAGFQAYFQPATLVALSGNRIDLASMTLDAKGAKPAAKAPAFEIVKSGGKVTSVIASGNLPLFSSENIPVDTTRDYQISIRLRILPNADGSRRSLRVYAGIATFDKEGVLQTSKPGTYRYALLAGDTLSSDDGWIERTATINGAGDERHNQFREGTASMRLVVLANYKAGPEARTEIADLAWAQMPR